MDKEIFQWASDLTRNIKEMPLIDITGADNYCDNLYWHCSMYHDPVTGKTLYCEYNYKYEDCLFWYEVNNFNKIKKDFPMLVDILLRNGEYLCTSLTRGKNLKIVKFSYVDREDS